MNQNPIVNLFRLKGIGQTRIPRQVSTLAISLAMLLLWVLTAHAEEPVNDPMVGGPKPVVAPGTVIGKEAASDPAFLAENPELKHARRYAEAIESEGSQSEAWSPILPPGGTRPGGLQDLELEQARRYRMIIESEGSQSETWSPILPPGESKPGGFQDLELEQARRYRIIIEKANLTVEEPRASQAAAYNVAALRHKFMHGLGIEAEVSQPIFFDKERLRRTYFQDWVLAADAPDVVKSSPAQTPDPWMGLVRSMYNRQAETARPGMVIRPVTFDVEALRLTYFQDWVLEADTIDRGVYSSSLLQRSDD